MFLLLSALSLASRSDPNTPIALYIRDFDVSQIGSPSSTCTCPDQRSIWDIVWGCLATVFACSWVAVHPNMPALGTSRWRAALSRLLLMTWTILAPEMVIFWAVRQWVGSRKIEKAFKDKGWTATHDHFLQMGGLVLYDGSIQCGVLSLERFSDLLKNGEIDFPTVTEEEIHGRSKGDALSKSLVIAQTTWFITQVIARWVQGLVITELELATLAFTTLNAFMYFFLVEQTLDAQLPLAVHLIHPRVSNIHYSFVEDHYPLHPTENLQPEGGVAALHTETKSAAVLRYVTSAFRKLSDLSHWVDIKLGPTVPTSRHGIRKGQSCVPLFYAFPLLNQEDRWISVALSLIGIIFGAIHCVGWNFSFPFHAETILWRCSSLIIALIPFGALVMSAVVVSGVFSFGDSSHMGTTQIVLVDGLFVCMNLVIIPVYVVARVVLTVEAFITLRDLSSSAQMEVEWTSFLPHI